MQKKPLVGAAVATIAALTFVSAPVTSAFADNSSRTVPCYGVNACKGHSQCKTATSSCKSQNSCKGQGFVMKTPEDCQKLGGSTTEKK